MEAAIACHAIHNETCFHCRHRHVLRWKGGSADAWQDLVCTNCQAIYEIKTKETTEHIRKAFEFNQIPGGSFRAACRLENSRPPNKKRFLVLLPRNATDKRGRMVHPVQVEEISKVLPAACESTFNARRQGIDIRSVVSVKKRISSLNRNSTRHWFDLPEVAHDRPLNKIAEEVFTRRFSEKEYEELKTKYFTFSAIPETEESKKSVDTTANETEESARMQSLIKKFEQHDTADDWEDLDSDSEEQY